jgi:cytoskeletal protein CcmA (bactofilin family)
MSNKGKIDFKNVHTMIGADAVIRGDIELKGGLITYGKVYGRIVTDGPVRVARSGAVYGDIVASDVHIGGLVEGNVTAQDRVVLGNESTLKGDLVYRRLLIEEGAQFAGRCDLRGGEDSTETPVGNPA